MDPSNRFTLAKVNRFFACVVKETQAPCIYIRPNLFENIPKKIDVMTIIEAAGIGSGLVIEIRRTIQRTNWKNAELTLKLLKYNWYEIIDISWMKNEDNSKS